MADGIYGVVTGDDKVEANIRAMPEKLRAKLVDAMKVQWFKLQALIVQSKLSGQVLKRKTGNLASSINVGGPMTATEFVDEGNQIIGRVGTKVWYGAVHEYGGNFQVKAHQRTITQVFGRTVDPHKIDVRSYSMNVPERSFLRAGLRDMSTSFREGIAASIKEAM